MRIEKKVWPQYFEKMLSGEKTFELRLADFYCKPGDILVLREWNPETKLYTGRTIETRENSKRIFLAKPNEIRLWRKQHL